MISMEIFLQILANGIFISALYALVAGGLSFLYATTKIFHLAHGVVLVASGYVFWWSTQVLNLHFLIAVIFAVMIAALIGWLMNEFVYEHLKRKNAKGLSYLIATLAMLMLGTGIILLFFGAGAKTFPFTLSLVSILGIKTTSLQLWILGSAIVLLTGFYSIIRFTRFGKAMRATADNDAVAEVLGINTRLVRRRSFLLASVLAAAAGIFLGLEFNLDPNMGVLLAVIGFAAAVIGGIGSFGGAIIGSLIIGLSEQGVIWFLGSGWRNAVTFLLLFIFLLMKPEGLFGQKKRVG
jgi:branched-chain amino acid transport system permease protein